MTAITQDQLDALLDKHLDLSGYGLGRGRGLSDESFALYRADLRRDLDQAQACVDWLATVKVAKRATWSHPSSYQLKHIVENSTFGATCGHYISNGAMIAAALLLGIPLIRGASPNPSIAVSRHSLRGVA